VIAVIFESWPEAGKMQRYLDMGAGLESHLRNLDGFISIERFQSVRDPTKLVALSFWRNAWRSRPAHRAVQSASRDEVFRDYRLRVATVIRDYGKLNREQAPSDSREEIG
jgi:heme-degrading monooxygenase HmoA